LAAPVDSVMTTSVHSPDPSSSTTWGLHESPPQPTLAAPKEAPAAIEGEATSLREAPRHIQHHHPSSDHDHRHRPVGHAVQVTSDLTLCSLCFRSFF
jgi:hypothetical protein